MAEAAPEGFYREEVNRTTWIIPSHYQNLGAIGSGAYGQVCSVDDTRNGVKMAIKKFSRPFQSVMHAKRALREVRLLIHMEHENVLHISDLFTPQKSVATFEDVYLTTTLMGADLNNITKVQTLSDEHVQFLVYQILRGLKYIHSAGIIHRDLKPSNLGVNENCELKILDFGLARSADDSMTGYVATRWYRAPEIMLNWMHYTAKVDVWSVGCIMAELISGRTTFPGNDHIDQLTKIMELVGKPSEKFLGKISSENAKNYIMSMPDYQAKDFSQYFPNASAEAIDLLYKLLALDPEDRLSAEEALQHPFFAAYHDPEDEPECHAVFTPVFNQESEVEVSIDFIKERLFEEIKNFVYRPPPPDDDMYC